MEIENQNIVEGNPQIDSYEFRKISYIRQYFFYFLFIITLGILYLPFHWFPKFYLLFYDTIQDIEQCTHIILYNDVGQIFILQYYNESHITNVYEQKRQTRYIEYNGIKYYFNKEENFWQNAQKLATKKLLDIIKQNKQQILTRNIAQELQLFYGKNSIEIKVKSFFTCLLENFFTPLNTYEMILFYVCIIVDSYVFLFLLIFYIAVQTTLDMIFYYQRVNKINKICHVNSTFKIIRIINDQEQEIEVQSDELVIGDTVLIQPQQILTCDVIVVEGSCLIDQAVLTGESIPINKTSVKNNTIEEINKILSGSKCIVLRSKILKAIVFRTGWNTYKGKLVGRLANQKLKTFKFIKELGQMMIISLIFYLLVIVLQLYFSSKYMAKNWKFNVLIVMELFTSALPASFFFVISICSFIISQRLKEKQIYTIVNSKILECGRVKNICFDKTGTLTENQIKIFGFALMNEQILEEPMHQMEDFQLFNQYQQFNLLLACCHSLNVINKQVIGDPIEEEMFKMTKFSLKEIQNQKNEFENIIIPNDYFKKVYKLNKDFNIRIIKELSFTSERKRMSTVIQNINQQKNQYSIFTKGAPEIMKNYMNPQTMPKDYDQRVKEFSEQGYRLLSMATKDFSNQNLEEQEIEQDLNFIGFMLLDNPLKDISPIIINKLQVNDISCAMITGDNIFTGINIGIKSNLIKNDQNIWVGQFKKNSQEIKWTYYNNNEIENLQNENLQILNNETISSSAQSQILKSRISRGSTFQGNQHIQKVINDIKIGVAVVALEGSVFEKLVKFYDTDQDIKELFLLNTKIYGRAKPSEKKLVIQQLKQYYDKQDYCVGFVGDGSNDAQALQEAHFGLSIGNNDSSLSASFSTKQDNIKPCINILEEGKMILENFVQIFQLCIFMGFINATCIFLLSLNGRKIPEILMAVNLIFWTPQFFFMSLSKPSKINKLYPIASFYRKSYMYVQFIPVIIVFILTIIFYYFLMIRDQAKDIYQINDTIEDQYYIEPVIFYILICILNYAMCLAYNRSYPFKAQLITNHWLIGLGIIVFLLIFVILFTDLIEDNFIGKFVIRYMYAADLQIDLRYYIILFISLQTIIVVCITKIINAVFLINEFKETYKKQLQLSRVNSNMKIQLIKLQCKIKKKRKQIIKKWIQIYLQIQIRKDLEKDVMQYVQVNRHLKKKIFKYSSKMLIFNNLTNLNFVIYKIC